MVTESLVSDGKMLKTIVLDDYVVNSELIQINWKKLKNKFSCCIYFVSDNIVHIMIIIFVKALI